MISVIESFRNAHRRVLATAPTDCDVLISDNNKTDVSNRKVLKLRLVEFAAKIAALLPAISIGYGISSTSPTAGVGYAAGAGGTVTQATSSATAVTLNKICGQITTVALTTAAGAEEVFTVNNTTVLASDVINVGTTYAGAGTPAITTKKNVGGTSFDIVITNLNASAALNAAVVINFSIGRVATT